MAMNVIVLQGNLVADPSFHGENDSVARFTLANNTGFGDNAEVHFIDCVAFGKQVETIQKFLTKGKEINIRGRLVQRRWETDEGEKRSKLEIRLENYEGFSFTSGGAGGGQSNEAEPVAAGAEKKLF
jgi:single-strand DNA-binding protein